MRTFHTKETAEAILRELPSVRGAFVREDVNGHPREVHILVGPGPEPRHLARDIRELLEERLGVPVDQRVISIAQLSDRINEIPIEELYAAGPDATGGAPSAALGPGGAAAGASGAGSTGGSGGGVDADPRSGRGSASGSASGGAMTPAASTSGASGPAAIAARGDPAEARVRFEGVESSTRHGRTEVRVRVAWRGALFEGSGEEIEGGQGRIRAAAAAALRAASEACAGRLRLELDAASVVAALGREYVLVSALAVSPLVGRRPLPLAGAHPLENGAETSAALAALQASNRVLALALRG